eukprot:1237652-Prymnesium_polylepis.1
MRKHSPEVRGSRRSGITALPQHGGVVEQRACLGECLGGLRRRQHEPHCAERPFALPDQPLH